MMSTSLLLKLKRRSYALLLLKVKEFNLSVRTMNCFKRMHLQYIGDVVIQKRSKLMEQPNFGRRSLYELREKLSTIGLDLDMNIYGWPPDNIENALKVYNNELEKIRRNRKEISLPVDGKCFLEDELNSIMKLMHHGRNERIVASYLGWDGLNNMTQEQIGQKFNITGERVCQIVSEFEKKMNRISIVKSGQSLILENALKFISDNLPLRKEHMELKLHDEGITKDLFRIEGIVAAAQIFKKEVQFRIVDIQGVSILVKLGLSGLSKLISVFARKSISSRGVCTIPEIAARIKENTGKSVKDDYVIDILSSLNGFRWLDESTGWFWDRSVPRNRLINIIRKVLSVSSQINVSELKSGINKDDRMQGLVPPHHVLLAFCKQISICSVKGDIIKSTKPTKWQDIWGGTVEGEMCSILINNGMVMPRKEFERECLARDINIKSFDQYLCTSPIFVRISEGLYRVRGSNINSNRVKSKK